MLSYQLKGLKYLLVTMASLRCYCLTQLVWKRGHCMIKGILTDMDGTILNSKGQLSSYTQNVLEEALRQGYVLAVASGRFFTSIHDVFKAFDQDIIYTCNNGSWIENSSRNRVYHKSTFSRLEVAYLLSQIRSVTSDSYFISTPDYAFTDTPCSILQEAFEKADSSFKIVDDLLQVNCDVTKISICVPKNIDKLSRQLKNVLGSSYELVLSGDIWLDILKPCASKANIFPILESEFSILPEEMLVFGDYDNDIPMLEKSPYSYAMANASYGAKKAAQFVIGTNDDHAVAKKIEELLF